MSSPATDRPAAQCRFFQRYISRFHTPCTILRFATPCLYSCCPSLGSRAVVELRAFATIVLRLVDDPHSGLINLSNLVLGKGIGMKKKPGFSRLPGLAPHLGPQLWQTIGVKIAMAKEHTRNRPGWIAICRAVSGCQKT